MPKQICAVRIMVDAEDPGQADKHFGDLLEQLVADKKIVQWEYDECGFFEPLGDRTDGHAFVPQLADRDVRGM